MGFIVLGSVFLAVTGAEALYADMGISAAADPGSWLFVVLPALICNYLGQGALILTDPRRGEPVLSARASWPGRASRWCFVDGCHRDRQPGGHHRRVLARQPGDPARPVAAAGDRPHLGYAGRPDLHPARQQPVAARVLALVLLFKTSDALANAYGIAVAGTMVMTTSLAFFVVWKLWRWPLWRACVLIAAFLSIDLAFFVANLYKVLDGGYVPLLLGASTFIVMWTWSRAARSCWRRCTATRSQSGLMKMLEKSKPVRVPGRGVPDQRRRVARPRSCTISSTTRSCTSACDDVRSIRAAPARALRSATRSSICRRTSSRSSCITASWSSRASHGACGLRKLGSSSTS